MGTRMQYTPMTQEEREFAAANHYMVEHYLRMKKLTFDEWYDVVIFRYLLSVKSWFARPELRQWHLARLPTRRCGRQSEMNEKAWTDVYRRLVWMALCQVPKVYG